MKDIDIGVLEDLLDDVKSGRLSVAGLRRVHERPYLVSQTFTEVKELWEAPARAVVSHDMTRAVWVEVDRDKVRVKQAAVSTDVEILCEHDGKDASGTAVGFERDTILVMSGGQVIYSAGYLGVVGTRRPESFLWRTLSLSFRDKAFELIVGPPVVILTRAGRRFDAITPFGTGAVKGLFHGFYPCELSKLVSFGTEGYEHVLFKGRVLDAEPCGVFLSGPRGMERLTRENDDSDSFDTIVSSVRMSKDGKRSLVAVYGLVGPEKHATTLFLDGGKWEPPSDCHDHKIGVYGFLEDGSPFHECRTCHTVFVQDREGGYRPYPLGNVCEPTEIVGHGIGKPLLASFDNLWVGIVDQDRKGCTHVRPDRDLGSLRATCCQAFVDSKGHEMFAFIMGAGSVIVVDPVGGRQNYSGPDAYRIGPDFRNRLRDLIAIPGTDRLVWVVSRKKQDGGIKDEFISMNGEAGMLHRKIVRIWIGDGSSGSHHIRYLAEDDSGRLRCYGIRLEGK